MLGKGSAGSAALPESYSGPRHLRHRRRRHADGEKGALQPAEERVEESRATLPYSCASVQALLPFYCFDLRPRCIRMRGVNIHTTEIHPDKTV